MDTKKLRAKRKGLIDEARALSKKAEDADRDLNTEERAQFDKLLETAGDLKDQIDREERLAEVERDLAANSHEAERGDPNDDNGSGDGNEGEQRRDAADYDAIERGVIERMAARGWAVPQGFSLGASNRRAAYDLAARTTHAAVSTDEYRAAYNGFIRSGTVAGLSAEARAMQADDLVSGGALVASVDFQRDLIQAVDDMVYLRQFGTVRTVRNAQSAGYPSLDTDVSDADWTSELATGTEDSDLAFGGRELHPHPLAKRLKISGKLLRLDPMAEALVRERLAYKFGVTMEKGGMTGTGSGQPLGLFVASSDGISTARDTSVGNSATAVAAEGFIRAKYKLKGAYHGRARWLTHRDTAVDLAVEKADDGQYIWRESTRVGEPDRLLGFPVHLSEFVPNTKTASQYVAILGDFSHYWWADALGMTVQRLTELYAETNQVGFIGRLESDGMPVLEEAFVRVQLTA